MTAVAPASVEVAAIVLDVRNLDRETAFWSRLLGSSVLAQGSGWVDVALLGANGPVLSLQETTARKWRRSGLHLDVVVDDADQAIKRAIELGATTVSDAPATGSGRWQVLADPEGNRFCLLQRA
jgi:predicted enzyme related to lactoylglutathione lyase